MSHTPLSQQPTGGRPADCSTYAVIDEQGREVPITEAMIKKACRALDQDVDEDDSPQA